MGSRVWQFDEMQIVVTANPQEAATQAAQWMGRRIRSAVRLRGLCRIAVSGGSTPGLMFADLAHMDVPWNAVHIFQVDERVAPDGDPDRNAGQLATQLLDQVPVRRVNVFMMPVTAPALARAAARYADRIGETPLDIVHLGMGDDGHTASWPPGDAVIDSPGDVAISGVFNGRIRMTLTPRVVNRARARMVLVTGTAKAEPLEAWLFGNTDLPVRRVRRGDTTVIADEAAAARLPPAGGLG